MLRGMVRSLYSHLRDDGPLLVCASRKGLPHLIQKLASFGSCVPQSGQNMETSWLVVTDYSVSYTASLCQAPSSWAITHLADAALAPVFTKSRLPSRVGE